MPHTTHPTTTTPTSSHQLLLILLHLLLLSSTPTTHSAYPSSRADYWKKHSISGGGPSAAATDQVPPCEADMTRQMLCYQCSLLVPDGHTYPLCCRHEKGVFGYCNLLLFFYTSTKGYVDQNTTT